MNAGEREPLSAEVRLRWGRPTLLIDGEAVLPVLYSLTHQEPACWSWHEEAQRNLRNFAGQGVRLVQVDLFLEHLWTSEDEFDIEPARRQIRGVLEAIPDAAVFLRFHVNTPPWWNEAHPDELVRYADCEVQEEAPDRRHIMDGDLEPRPRVSLASRLWRREAGEKLSEFCRLLADTPEGNVLAGLQIACGVYGEWHYWAFIEHDPDTGPAMTAEFRRWLRQRYGRDDVLQEVWGDPSASLSNAQVPGLAERRKTADGFFRDPRRERRVIDYYLCQQETAADAVVHFCRIARESWPRPLVTGTFYGYYLTMFNRLPVGGHLELQRILRSPWVDYLSAPQSYMNFARDPGGTGQSRGLVESCVMHGKLWLDEMDRDPELDGELDEPDGRERAVAVMRRNVVEPLLRGGGLWYYDFGASRGRGWWDHPELLENVGALRNVFAERLSETYESPADVLLVYDTRCFCYLGDRPETDTLSTAVIDRMSADACHAGVAIDTVHLGDLEEVDWDRYRAVVFGAAWMLSEEQRSFIRERVAGGGRHLIWMHAPGYTDGVRLEPAWVSEVTAVELEKVKVTGSPEVMVDAEELPETGFGPGRPVAPLFAVRDGMAEPLGELQPGGHIGLARKELADSTVWYCSLPLRGPDLMREIFRQAGAHIYVDSGDVVHAGWGLLCIHTLKGGPRTLRLRNGDTAECVLPPRSTTLWDAETGELLPG
ncbi:MAG: hypothetical protein R6X33_14360 [Candidatus Brocadiia bacterium]